MQMQTQQIQIQEQVPKNRREQIARLQAQNPTFYDSSRLYWIWDQTTSSYNIGDETDVMNIYYNFTNDINGVKPKIKNEIMEAIRQTGRELNVTDPDPNYIQFKNCIIDINTSEKFMATPEYKWVNPIPHNLGTDTKTPIIDKLFIDWVGHKNVQSLYEILAYSLYRKYPIHVIFALYGIGRNGKSQFNKIVEKLIGDNSICTTSLESIGKSRFETAKMYHKNIAFISETDSSTMRNTATLKSLCGDDPISGEIKNKNPFTFTNYAKIIIATNNLPSAYDESQGYASRWLIINFPNQFKGGKPVVDLISELEYENLCNKLITILQKLLITGSFTGEKSIEEKTISLKRGTDPLLAFIDEEFIEDDSKEITGNDFISLFKVWIKKYSINYEIKNRKIYPELKKLGIEIKRKSSNGNKYQLIYGLKYFPSEDDPKIVEPESNFYDSENMINPFDNLNGGYLEPDKYDYLLNQIQPKLDLNEEYDKTHDSHTNDEW